MNPYEGRELSSVCRIVFYSPHSITLHLCEEAMDPLPTPVFVYLDNSNIFLSTQSYSAKINKYKDGIMDVQCRLNVSKLLDIVLNGRIVTLKKAYGHMSKEVSYPIPPTF